MPISGWFMVYNEREWSGNRRRMCISRHRQLCVLFVFIFIILWGVIILLVLRRHSSNMCCFVFIIYIITILFVSQKTNEKQIRS